MRRREQSGWKWLRGRASPRSVAFCPALGLVLWTARGPGLGPVLVSHGFTQFPSDLVFVL